MPPIRISAHHRAVDAQSTIIIMFEYLNLGNSSGYVRDSKHVISCVPVSLSLKLDTGP
jgi:hypothetical protein